MLKKIFGTFGTRLLNAICGFITLWFGTHYLGDEAWGVGGVVLLDVSLLLIGVEFLSGSGLIFFTPRKSFRTLFKISYIWAALVVAFYALIMYICSIIVPQTLDEFIPEEYQCMVLVLVFIYSIHNFNLTTLLGKERVATNNILFIIQFMTQMFAMLFFIFVMNIRDAHAFVYSLLTGYVVGYICGLTQIWQYLKEKGSESIWQTIKEMLRFGTIIQVSTLVSMLNRRLSYLIIRSFWGDAHVGVYSAATQVSESPKLIGLSIAMVQFSKISNLTDNDLAAKITIKLVKMATLLTALCMLVICIIPTSVYSWLFTSNFAPMRVVMIALAPGIVFMAAHMVFVHYFSGTNKPQYDLYGALIGLAVTIPSLYLLIPPFGMVGAGMSVSITYFSIVLYNWIIFRRLSKLTAKELLVTKDDVKNIITQVKEVFKR